MKWSDLRRYLSLDMKSCIRDLKKKRPKYNSLKQLPNSGGIKNQRYLFLEYIIFQSLVIPHLFIHKNMHSENEAIFKQSNEDNSVFKGEKSVRLLKCRNSLF